MIKICVVEDEASIRDMLQFNLELEGHKVDVYSNGKAAFDDAADFQKFDLVILDVMLPGVSGLTICEEIRKYSNVPVLFLSAKGTTQDKIAGLKKGGNDYLSKPFDLEELLLRIKVLTEGITQSVSDIDSLKIGNKLVDFATFEVIDHSKNEKHILSKKEIDLLKLFHQKEGKVVSRDEILDKVWGKDQFPTSRTIDNYILNFRKLFESDPKQPEFFHSIRSVGYKFTNSDKL
jgi:two-component system alkaline phosphatase synthesis response regulator PhoP